MATRVNSDLIHLGAVVGYASASTTSLISGSGFSNWANGVFLSTEGGDILSVNYTPKAIGNRLVISGRSCIRRDATGDSFFVLGVFQSGVTNALGSSINQASSGGFPTAHMTAEAVVTVTSLATTTYKLRGAAYVAHTGTVYLNYCYYASTQGGATLSVTEVSA